MLLIDAHVHIYDCFNLHNFFNEAFSNFQSAADQLKSDKTFTGILLLAENSKDNWFQYLASAAGGGVASDDKKSGSWTFHRTGEDCSLHARFGANKSLTIIAGRQIVTAERLELISILSGNKYQDGLPLKNLVGEINATDGISVIPWGVGKWMGKRGRFLKNWLNSEDGSGFFWGDNSGRPNFWPRPYLFKSGDAKGIRILPGSDALPFAGEEAQVGSFGFACDEDISDTTPAKDLNRILKTSATNFNAYGRLETPLRFLHNQLRMQIRKHIG